MKYTHRSPYSGFGRGEEPIGENRVEHRLGLVAIEVNL
jgi:hypothetical protein